MVAFSKMTKILIGETSMVMSGTSLVIVLDLVASMVDVMLLFNQISNQSNRLPSTSEITASIAKMVKFVTIFI